MFSKTHRKTTWLALFLVSAVFPLVGIIAHAAPKPKMAKQKTIHTSSLNNALFNAIDKNNLHAVQALLAQGADVNARNENRLTPLMAALNDCDKSAISLQIIETLVNKKANVNARDGEGTGVLIYGVDSGSLPIIQLLLHHGADVNIRGQYDETPLSRAIDQDNPAIVKLLLDAGASAKSGFLAQSAGSTDNIAIAQLLLAHGANVNEKDSEGNTPLMQAAGAGHTAMVIFLLQKGANLEAKNTPEGETALRQAADDDKIETAKLLLAAGANPNAQDSEGMSVLDEAIMNDMGRDDTAFVQLLLDHGATPDSGFPHESSLLSAASFGEKNVVELLLASGGGAHTSDGDLYSALVAVLVSGSMMNVRMGLYGYAATLNDKQKNEVMAKAEANDTAIVQDLLDHGADVSKFPKGAALVLAEFPNHTALAAAAADGIAPIVRLLLDKGAPVNGSDTEYEVALNEEAEKEAKMDPKDAVVILEMPKERGPKYITPLMAAAENGQADVCQMLLDAGADPNLEDTDGQTALMHVVQSGRNKIAYELPRLRENVLHRADDSAEKPTSREVKPAEATAMQKWADEGDIAIIKALLAKKADVQTPDKQGQTALMLAAANSSPAVVQTLIDAGAALNAQDASGQNALMQVIKNGRISNAPQLFSRDLQTAVQMVNKYKDHYSKPEIDHVKSAAAQQQDRIIQSATGGDMAIIKALLTAGIDLNAKDKKGQTALQMAQETHHGAIIALLEQSTAKTGHINH